jgi:hypothetical protein
MLNLRNPKFAATILLSITVTPLMVGLLSIFLAKALPAVGVLLGIIISVNLWKLRPSSKMLFWGCSLVFAVLTGVLSSINYYYMCTLLPTSWELWSRITFEKCILEFEYDVGILIALFILLSVVILTLTMRFISQAGDKSYH